MQVAALTGADENGPGGGSNSSGAVTMPSPQIGPPPTQAPFEQAWSPEHTCPHAPQLVGSVVVLISQPSTALPLQLADPAWHVSTHVWLLQTFVAPGTTPQTVPHVPQLSGENKFASQPSAGLLLQSAKPGLQIVITHWLLMHAVPAFALAHTAPHAPQLLGSALVATHVVPHSVCPDPHVGGGGGVEQSAPVYPAAQTH